MSRSHRHRSATTLLAVATAAALAATGIACSDNSSDRADDTNVTSTTGSRSEAGGGGTTADITTSLDEVGDDLVLRVTSVRTGISYSKLKPPRFPQSALRHRAQADLLAKVSVGADGKATAIEIVGASEDNEEFEQSVRDAINGWRFKNETLNGEPVAGTINVPIRFSMACQRGDKGFELSAAAPKQLVLAAGNRANADLIEVAASRRMSGPKPCE